MRRDEDYALMMEDCIESNLEQIAVFRSCAINDGIPENIVDEHIAAMARNYFDKFGKMSVGELQVYLGHKIFQLKDENPELYAECLRDLQDLEGEED